MGDLHLTARPCRHGGWTPHNGWLLDGEFIADPDGLCPGGTVEHDGIVRGVSHVVGAYLSKFDLDFDPDPVVSDETRAEVAAILVGGSSAV